MIFRTYKADTFYQNSPRREIKSFATFCFLFLLIINSPILFAQGLSPEQKQEIRFTKAISLFNKGLEKEGLKLLRTNLDGPFHYKTEQFLARYFFDKRKFTKSFRLYQHMLKNTYSREIVDFNFNHRIRTKFYELIRSRKKPEPLALQVSFEAAEKFFEAYTLKVFPEEFSTNLLNLAEKYFSICVENELYVAPSKYYLSKIYFERKEDQRAISLLREAREDYSLSPDKNLELGLRIEDIELLLGEALARSGNVDSGTLILRSLYSRDNTTSSTKSYARSFLREIKSSYFDASVSYQMKSKSNINQLDAEDYSNFDNLANKAALGQKDGTVHHRRFNFFTSQELSPKYQASASFTYINESPTQEVLKHARFDQTTLEVNLKRYRQKNSFYAFDYRFNNLSGRRFQSLNFIQATSSHTFTPNYNWIGLDSRWKISLPIENRSYLDGRSASSLALQFDYRPILKDSWWSPSYFGTLGRRSEGEDFDSSLFYQLGFSNSHEFSTRLYWLVLGDFYTNANSDALLNYNELTITNAFSYFLKNYPQLSLEIETSWRRRSQDGLGSITTLDVGAGVSYNF